MEVQVDIHPAGKVPINYSPRGPRHVSTRQGQERKIILINYNYI